MYNFEKFANKGWISENIINLYRIERKQTFPAWNDAARYVNDLLIREGFETEFIPVAADGRTAYFDKISPIGWDCTRMNLTLVTDVKGISDPMLASFEREPLQAVKHSVSLPEGGVTVRLVTQSQMKAGSDVRGGFVLLDPSARPHKADLRQLLDLGAIGFVSDYIENPMEYKDGVSWLNAGTEHTSWHVMDGERDFIGFMITPMQGFHLRAACERGEVLVHAESDGHRYPSVLPIVTAKLSGESEKEVWLQAHLYEPLIDDNSAGVIGSIAVMKALRDMKARGLVRQKYTLRVIFASELYGFSAYVDAIGDFRRNVLGSINMDGLVASTDKNPTVYRAFEAPDYRGSDGAGGYFGNVLFHEATEEYANAHPEAAFLPFPHHLSDDCGMGDASIGIPTVWLFHTREGFHHNSVQDEKLHTVDNFIPNLSACSEWIYRMCCLTEADVRALLPRAVRRAQKLLNDAALRELRPDTDTKAYMDFLYRREINRIEGLRIYADIPEINKAKAQLHSVPYMGHATKLVPANAPWYTYAKDFVFTRLTAGFPHDMAKLAPDDRFYLPGEVIEVELASVISRLDGRRTLQDALREVEWDKGYLFGEAEIKSYVLSLLRLCPAGYMKVAASRTEGANALASALGTLGIKAGDAVALSVSMDEVGYVEGAAGGIVDGAIGAVGERGAVMVPAFAASVIFANDMIARDASYRPYDAREDGALRDRTLKENAIALAMRDQRGAVRSNHICNEWFGVGCDFAACGATDAPYGEKSPITVMAERGGYAAVLGSGALSEIIAWAMRDKLTDTAIVRVIGKDGATDTEVVRNYPRPIGAAEAEAFLARCVEKGLTVRSVPFGMTSLRVFKLNDLEKTAI